MTRRQLLLVVCALAGALVSCSQPARQLGTFAAVPAGTVDSEALDRFITAYMEEKHIPGLAAAIVFADGLVWTQGYGLADVASRRAMTPDTVINVASITKTITNLAVLQLRDQGLLSLDDPIGRHLPFEVVHPRHPDVAITVRQLLTHTGGVADGDAYDESYACGDPQVELGVWLREYFTPGGRYYDREQNFLEHAPGARYSYSNLGYGLLGHLVEVASGESFATRTRAALFEPLGMDSSGWRLDVVPRERQAVLYEWVEPGEVLDGPLFGGRSGATVDESGLVPYCPYSFYNLSDGLLRTSVRDLSRFLLAHMNAGEVDGRRVLRAETVGEMFSRQLAPERLDAWEGVQGLTWRQRELAGQALWEHSGADPGVRTRMAFSPDDGVGVLVFANRLVSVRPVFERLFEESRSIAAGLYLRDPPPATLLVSGTPGGLASLCAALFVPSLALALGAWSGTPRLFEIVYLMLWYVGPLSGVAPFDFLGSTPESLTEGTIWLFALLSAPLAASAALARVWRLRR